MLRIFRLSPAFQLDISPPNIMYIDISAPQDTRRYLETPSSSFLDNYLILQPTGEPTVSDLDILKSYRGLSQPYTCALGTRDIYARPVDTGTLQISRPIYATSPSRFIINICSIYTCSQKLTTDTNEALLCTMSYYHPDPPPKLMIVDNSFDEIARANESTVINYKGVTIVPVFVDLDRLLKSNESNLVVSTSAHISDMYLIRYSDETIFCKTITGGPNKYIEVDIYDIPLLHSNLVIHNVFEKGHRSVKYHSSEFRVLKNGICKFEYALTGCYKNAVVPHYNQLKSLKQEIEKQSRHRDYVD